MNADIFVGRSRELAQLRDVAARTAAGEPWVAGIEGNPGVGKSSLVRRFVADLDCFTVLWAAGDPTERDYGYGVIDQLLASVDRALGGRFSLGSDDLGAQRAPLEVGRQLLLLLGQLQSAGPVVLAIDDWQWADELSAVALGFAVRRLWSDAVLTVLTFRSWPEGPADVGRRLLSSGRVLRLSVGGLSVPEVGLLASRLRPEALSTADVERLHAQTGGHVLYVRTLLTELPAAGLGRAGRPWPVPVSLAGQIQSTLARLPTPSQTLVEALTVLGGAAPLAQVAMLAGLDDPLPALESAIAAGLVERRIIEPANPVAFRHPLQRDAVYAMIELGRRRQLHATAAELVDARSSWAHQVSAAMGVSPGLAADLEVAADLETAAGENALAATHLLWAADLTGDQADRERRILRAAGCLLAARMFSRAESLHAQIQGLTPSPLRSAVLGWYAISRAHFAEALPHLEHALSLATSVAGLEGVAALAGNGLGTAHSILGNGQEVTEAAECVLGLGSHIGLESLETARLDAATGQALLLGPQAAAEVFACRGWLPDNPATAASGDSSKLTVRGLFQLFSGRLAAAAADAAAALRLSRDADVPAEVELAYAVLGLAQYLLGQWDEALISADAAVSVALAEGKVWSYSLAYHLVAVIRASQANLAGADEAAGESSRCVPRRFR